MEQGNHFPQSRRLPLSSEDPQGMAKDGDRGSSSERFRRSAHGISLVIKSTPFYNSQGASLQLLTP